MEIHRQVDRKRMDFQRKREEAKLGGGLRRIEAQHNKGKLTARERIDLFLDPETFEELDSFVEHRGTEFGLADKVFPGDAVVTGYGKVDGRLVFLFSQDFTVLGGSLSEVVAQKICKVMDFAVNSGAPLVGMIDSGGARIQEGIDGLAGYGAIFHRHTRASGVIPQLSIILGPAAGGATYSPALTDYVFMTSGISQMYITGPDVIKAVTGESVTHEELGGAISHASKSGVAHFVAGSEKESFGQVKRLLGFLPSNNKENPPKRVTRDYADRTTESLNTIIPEGSGQPYDIVKVVTAVVDDGEFMQVHELFARNMVVGYGRMQGRTVGIVATQPDQRAGVLDINASVKAARFIRFCDAFNIPLVTFVDVPGFMPGTDQEHGGIIRHGAKLAYAYAEASVPKISILTRKAYGGAYIVMSSKRLTGDINYSWPTGEVATMGAEGAVNIIYRNELKNSERPAELRSERVQDYQDRFMTPYIAASRGLVDEVIEPAETRPKIIRALEMLGNKRELLPPKKHGSIPL